MIYLVRHGQTAWNIKHKTQGQTDVPLNAQGRRQARELLGQIAPLSVDRIVSSDLSRARQTAQIVNRVLQKPFTTDSRLREINYGHWEGSVGLHRSQEEWDVFNHHPDRFQAEAMAHVFERIRSFCEEIKERDNSLIVTHGGAIRMMMYYVKNPHFFDLEDYLKTYPFLVVKNTDIFQWNQSQNTISRLGRD